MPIQNVIDILISGKDKHFDGNLVDVFLKISADKVVRVFLTENHHCFKDEDSETLSRYNLKDIYNFINDENATDEQNILRNCLIFIILGM